ATWSWASGITQRWILETSPVFMAFMNPTATSLSDCPEKGLLTSWKASGSTGCGAEVTGLTTTTSPVLGTPAVQAASPGRVARATRGRRSRARRLPTDGDLRDGRGLGLRLRHPAGPPLRAGGGLP